MDFINYLLSVFNSCVQFLLNTEFLGLGFSIGKFFIRCFVFDIFVSALLPLVSSYDRSERSYKAHKSNRTWHKPGRYHK